MPKFNATRLYYLILGLHGLFYYLFATVNILYQVTTAHLNPLQLVLVGTIFELAVFLFEVPTGVVADTISRRTSIIIGYFIFGTGLALQGLFPTFEMILISAAIFGVGLTFFSGAREAWIADEAESANVGQIFLRGAQIQQLGSLIGMILSVILAAAFQVSTPIVIGGLLFMGLGTFLLFSMPEAHFSPKKSNLSGTLRQMLRTFEQGVGLVRVKPVLITILLIALIQGMASEGFDRLWLKHLNDDVTFPAFFGLEPVYWMGLIYAISIILTAIGTEFVRRRLDTESHLKVARAQMLMNGAVGAAVIAYGVNFGFAMALVIYWVIMTLRRTTEPIFTAWINQSATKEARATLFSISNQADALGEILGAPIVGLIGLISVPGAIVTAGVIWLIALPLYRRAMRARVGVGV